MRAIVLRALFAMSVSIVACSPVQFSKISQNDDRHLERHNHLSAFDTNPSAANGESLNFKSENPRAVQCSQDFAKMPIKVLFVVDTSGSNSFAYRGSKNGTCVGSLGCVPATDPNKKFRSGSIREFFEKYKDKTNFSWGFETFSGNDVQFYIGRNMNDIFGDAQAMESAIDLFNHEYDRGKTPYLKAMEALRAAVSNDYTTNFKVEYPPLYYIVFMSDGYPTDSTPAEINAEVEDVIALDASRISLSTIYYGTQNDPGAAWTLQNMASTGGGEFVNFDTNSHDTISIQDLIGLPTTTCL